MKIARTSTRPVKICCQFACSPMYGKPVFSSDITKTPNRVPVTVPTPPFMDVPPMIAPAIASNSSPAPVPGGIAWNVAA